MAGQESPLHNAPLIPATNHVQLEVAASKALMAGQESPMHNAPLIPATNHVQLEGKSRAEPYTRRRECWGARHTVAVLALFGILLDYMIQAILAVTVVAMVGEHNSGQDNHDVCPFPDGQNNTEVMESGEFAWDERTQGMIQGAMNIGCAIISLPGGRMGELFGGTRMFGLMLACGCLLSLVSPLAAYSSTWLFISLRMLQGIAVGGMFPSLNIVIVAWFPPEERGKFYSIILTGMNLGSVTCMALAGWLCELGWLGGWPAPFYVVGVAGMVWSVLWFLFIHPTPEEHPRISQEELHYILRGGKRAKEKETRRFPWSQFLSSPQVWVQALTCMGDTFSYYIIMNMVPTYLTNIQHFSLRNTGVIAALPHLLSCMLSVCWGFMVGRLTSTHSLTKQGIKRLSTIIGLYGPALCMLGMCLVGCNKDAAVVLLILCVCANTCNFTGIFTTYQELCPTFCATFMGFVGVFTSTTGTLGPVVTGLMINDSQTLGAWRNVFITSAVIYIASCTLYLIFTPVRQQSWDNSSSLTSLDKASS